MFQPTQSGKRPLTLELARCCSRHHQHHPTWRSRRCWKSSLHSHQTPLHLLPLVHPPSGSSNPAALVFSRHMPECKGGLEGRLLSVAQVKSIVCMTLCGGPDSLRKHKAERDTREKKSPHRPCDHTACSMSQTSVHAQAPHQHRTTQEKRKLLRHVQQEELQELASWQLLEGSLLRQEKQLVSVPKASTLTGWQSCYSHHTSASAKHH